MVSDDDKVPGQRSLAKRLNLVVVLAACVPMLVIGVYALYVNGNALEQAALASMRVEAGQAAKTVERVSHDVANSLRFLGRVPPIQGIVRARQGDGWDQAGKSSYAQWTARLATIFAEFAAAGRYYRQLRYLDEQGRELVSVSYRDGKVQVSAEAALISDSGNTAFVGAMGIPAGDVYVSSFVAGPAGPVVYMATPVMDASGTRYGVIMATVPGGVLTEHLARVEGKQARRYALLDAQGHFLFGGDSADARSAAFDMRVLRGDDGRLTAGVLDNVAGQEIAFAPVDVAVQGGANRWLVLEQAARSEVLAPVYSFRWVFLGLTLLVLVAALAVTYRLTRRALIEPLDDLGDTLRRFSNGDTGVRARRSGMVEIDHIAGVFNAMADQHADTAERERQQLEALGEAADIRDQVDALAALVDSLAEGDLRQQVPAMGNQQLDRLGAGLSRMIERQAEVIRAIVGRAQAISTQLEDIVTAVKQQAGNASEQSSAVAETTTALEQIRVISQQTRERSRTLGDTASRTGLQGQDGMARAELAIAGMTDVRTKVEGIAETILALSEQSQQISDITETVNSLAQQLKMLALNASIEAAKAGEAGKGFAVVAMEVKDLAEQSQQATEQVNGILHDIRRAADQAVMVTEEGTKGVDQGMSQVVEAGNAMRSLFGVIQETAEASHSIQTAVAEEAAGIDQISDAMRHIHDASVRSLATTRDTEAAVASLDRIAADLKAAVDTYRV